MLTIDHICNNTKFFNLKKLINNVYKQILAQVLINFPESDNWEISSPEIEGINSSKVDKLMEMSFMDNATQAVVVIKNGKIIVLIFSLKDSLRKKQIISL